MRKTILPTLIALATLLGTASAHAASERVETSLHRGPLALVDATAPRLEGTININTASEKELELLPGIGPSTARKLVAYREKHDQFKDVLHVMRIKGIGRKTFEQIKPFLTLSGETTLRKVK